MTLAEMMRQARQDAGLSQREASRRSGIRQSLISRYESGVITHPTDVHLRLLADVYEADVVNWEVAMWRSLVPSSVEVNRREGFA